MIADNLRAGLNPRGVCDHVGTLAPLHSAGQDSRDDDFALGNIDIGRHIVCRRRAGV